MGGQWDGKIDDEDDLDDGSLCAIAASLGVGGLFRGTQARLVQMLAIVVVQLLVYDSIKALVGLPVTGVTTK